MITRSESQPLMENFITMIIVFFYGKNAFRIYLSSSNGIFCIHSRDMIFDLMGLNYKKFWHSSSLYDSLSLDCWCLMHLWHIETSDL